MGLSNDLISQFVKVTKDEQKTNKESIVYGTIQEDTRYVKIDGSDILTPISTTTVLGKGDRVTVMIKNHTATVTGNLTSPSARVVDTVTVDEIVATYAEIDKLIAADVEIQNTLKTEYLTAEQIESDYAKIKDIDSKYITTEKLEADYAKISTLESDYAKISTLESDYATIANLDAVKGDITTLNSEIANIDSLIFGSASGNVIQTSFANSVIAQLGDAQIKSAMIESISASKILAGDIITNNVHVKSNDGRLIISDETISISDDTRVRVQIGKDKSNDYSINVWDQNGNLMFSEGGITDAAIKQAIIRDDMVSETANINASKLDISSLFREINDSSSTIKSTKIYLDEEGQTLDISFKSLTTEVTEQGETIASQGEQLSSQGEQLSSQGETISSQGTAISTIQGQISSKIWQQDIDTATDTMSTYYSVLQQNFNSFQTTVSTNYATKDELTVASGFATPEEVGYIFDITDPAELPNIGEGVTKAQNAADAAQAAADAAQDDIDDLDIGGRNFARNTIDTSKTYTFSSWQYYLNNDFPVSDKILPHIINDREITVSAYINNIAGNEDVGLMIHIITPETSIGYTQILSEEKIAPGESGWVRHTHKLTDVGTQGTATEVRVALRHYSGTAGESTVGIHSLKLELGNRATGWTPAPEDIESEITNLDVRITSAESSITQLSNKITANVTETTNLGTRMTTVEQTAEDLTVGLDNLEIGGRNLIQWNKIIYHNTRLISGNSTKNFTISGDLYNSSAIFFNEQLTNLGIYTLNLECDLSATVNYRVRILTNVQINGYTNTYNEAYDQWGYPYFIDIPYYELPFIFTINEPTNIALVPISFTGNDGASLNHTFINLKLEKGNKPTDWTPAPEDVESDILNASKTATNYLNFSSSGLVIGDLTADTLGKNVLIDSDSVDIRNGDTTLASFGADYLYLAKNSRNAKIDLCNGLATMYHESKYSYDTIFIIDTGNTTEIMGLINPLCVTSVDDLDQVSIQFANANGVMGGIGIVGNYLRRFGSNMFDNYTILDKGNFDDVMDSGWISGGFLGENFTIYSNDDQIQYRKIGKIVHIRGTVRPTTIIPGSSDNYTIFTLPEGYRPSKIVNVRCQGSGAYSWLLSITTSGLVRFARYNDGTKYVDTSTTSWLPFDVTFFID